jgi:hypothetical protein
MPTRPLNPNGGRATKLWFSASDPIVEKADLIARARGFTHRAEYLRTRFEQIIAADEAALQEEGASKAS